MNLSDLSGPAGLAWLATHVIAFVLGSIPFGLLVARIFKVKDLTSSGSGNIGATNVTRVAGFWPAGFLTFVLDLGKGALSAALGTTLGVEFWSGALGLSAEAPSEAMPWVLGMLSVLGHCYSPWLNFKGGKGVATGFGVLLVLSPIAAGLGFLGFVLMFVSKRVGSLSSLTGLVVAAVAHLVLHPVGLHLWAGALMVLAVLIRHEGNLDALLENRERAF